MFNQKLQDWVFNTQSFFAQINLRSGLCLLLLGALNTLAYSPFDVWFIPFVTLTLLLLAVNQQTTLKAAAKTGFLYGLGWFGVGISWVHIAIADFGGLPLLASILLMVLLCAYLALFPALASYLFHKFKSKFGLSGFVVFWMSAEFLRSWLLTGFPWLAIGYTQTFSPLKGYAAIIGETGIQFIVLCIVTLLVTVLSQQAQRLVKLSVILLIFILGYLLSSFSYQTDNSKELSVALVQGNIEQSIKWQPENEVPTMKKYANLTIPHWQTSDIIIWPEAAVPRLEIVANEFLMEMDRQAFTSNTALITGIVDYQPDSTKAFNDLIVLGKQHSSDKAGHYEYLHNNRYAKHHLLPIGEFVPFESVLRKIGPLFNLPMSSFTRGSYVQDNLVANDVALLPAICFEIAFSEQLRANLFNHTDVILTVSNDAWFGDSHGPWQHLQIAQMRALEFAKPVWRVTNNGVTAFINHKGEIEKRLQQNVDAVLAQKIQITPSSTPYAQFGYLPTVISMLILLAYGYFRRHHN